MRFFPANQSLVRPHNHQPRRSHHAQCCLLPKSTSSPQVTPMTTFVFVDPSPSGNPSLKCQICSKIFDSNKSLRHHVTEYQASADKEALPGFLLTLYSSENNGCSSGCWNFRRICHGTSRYTMRRIRIRHDLVVERVKYVLEPLTLTMPCIGTLQNTRPVFFRLDIFVFYAHSLQLEQEDLVRMLSCVQVHSTQDKPSRGFPEHVSVMRDVTYLNRLDNNGDDAGCTYDYYGNADGIEPEGEDINAAYAPEFGRTNETTRNEASVLCPYRKCRTEKRVFPTRKQILKHLKSRMSSVLLKPSKNRGAN